MGIIPEPKMFNFKHFPSPAADEAFVYPQRLVKEEVVFRPSTIIFQKRKSH
jgi:hypothetical protein